MSTATPSDDLVRRCHDHAQAAAARRAVDRPWRLEEYESAAGLALTHALSRYDGRDATFGCYAAKRVHYALIAADRDDARRRQIEARTMAERGRIQREERDRPDPESLESIETTHALLSRLPRRTALGLWLTCIEGRTATEAAAVLGVCRQIVDAMPRQAARILARQGFAP